MLKQLLSQALQQKPEFAGMDDVVEKEILHHEIMYLLHKEGYLQQLTFMGGTALRLCYGSNRLSEDLDFTGGQNFTPGNFDGLAEALQQHLHNIYRLKVAVHEPILDKGDTSTWKITIEKFANRPDLPSQKLHIDICAYPSLDPVYQAVVDHYHIGSKIDGLPIAVESLQEILADKLIAFAYRERRLKPRDVWDLVWLSQRDTKLSASLIEKKLAFRGKNHHDFIELIHQHAEQIRSNEETKRDFYQEMSRFVPPDVAKRTLDQAPFWPYVGTIVSTYVDKITAALEQNSDDLEMKM